jgi:hypothetical protein
LAKLSGKTRRVNVTLPERVLPLDKYVSEWGNASGLIAQALEYIVSVKALPSSTAALRRNADR